MRVYKVAALYYTSCVWTHVAYFCLLGREGRRERGRRRPRGRGGQGGQKGRGRGWGEGREGRGGVNPVLCLLSIYWAPCL